MKEGSHALVRAPKFFCFFFHGQRKTSLPSSEGIVVEYDI